MPSPVSSSLPQVGRTAEGKAAPRIDLPPEIWAHIIRSRVAMGDCYIDIGEDEYLELRVLEDLKSFSLAGSHFIREECQKYIFAHLRLRPSQETFCDGRKSVYGKCPATEFAKAVAGKPRLTQAVKTFSYEIGGREVGKASNEVVQLLEELNNVKHFTFSVEYEYRSCDLMGSNFFREPAYARHAQGVLSIMGGAALTTLELQNVSIPISTLGHCSTLRSLHLHSASISILEYKRLGDLVPSSTVIYPRELLLDGYRSHRAIRRILQDEVAVKFLPLQLKRVRKVTAELGSRETNTSQDGARLLLKNAECLNELTLKDATWISDAYGAVSNQLPSPLACLNSRSFATLRRFTYKIRICIETPENGLPRVLDPFNGLFCNQGLLKHLTALEYLTLEVSVMFVDVFESDNYDVVFGPQWKQLDSLLAPEHGSIGCPLPKLKKVSFTIEAHAQYPALHKRMFEGLVMDRHLTGLRVLKSKKTLKLHVGVNGLDMGPSVAE
ncbi:hypothetical protein DFP72DRAFT_851860 [Ephemerocybe angulata]|uniref:Uncharacterized protein n=1 Tax=Ephemerocybe angulata TaxID=980116 RepID=A0A8H6M1U3_9AGAR|nr:hypothetical protein DFP72DRAFT_851860 [Tulosesus angulatus]